MSETFEFEVKCLYGRPSQHSKNYIKTYCDKWISKHKKTFTLATVFPKGECTSDMYFRGAHQNNQSSHLTWQVKKCHQFEIDTLVLSDCSSLICNDTVCMSHLCLSLNPSPTPLKTGTFAWMNTNLTSRYKGFTMFPANHDTNNPLETTAGANAWLFYTKWIRAMYSAFRLLVTRCAKVGTVENA